MSVSTTELTYSHTGGLGDLDEVALLNMFACSLAKRTTEGKDHSIRDIVGADGSHLYPSFYTTHLRVPPTKLLSSYKLWTEVSIGVDTSQFGAMLDSTCVMDHAGEVRPSREEWQLDEQPSLRAGSIFIVDNQAGVPRTMNPHKDQLAEMPKASKRSELVSRFDEAAARGMVDADTVFTFRTKEPFLFPIKNGRDACYGRNLMFSKFSQFFREAERSVLTERLHTPFPTAVADHCEVLEREVHYLSNCRNGSTLRIQVAGRLDACSPQLHGKSPIMKSCAIVSFGAEIMEEGSNDLLAICRSQQLLVIPSREKALVRDAKRLTQLYSK